MNAVNNKKLLSLITTGRNDAYMGNFIYRLSAGVNHLAQNLHDLGRLDDVEVVVTDWGSDDPLRDVLKLSDHGASITRIVQVPQSIAESVYEPGQTYYASCALNVGIQRSHGMYIGCIDSGILFPGHSIDGLLNHLESKSRITGPLQDELIFLGRYHIPWEIVQREPTEHEWDDYLERNCSLLKHEVGPAGVGMAGGGHILHRNTWHDMRGFDEQFRYWGWSDIELTLRASQRHLWVEASTFGVTAFHLEHYPSGTRVAPKKQSPQIISPTYQVNSESWGLGGSDLEILDGKPGNPNQPSDLIKKLESLRDLADDRMLKSMQSAEVQALLQSACRGFNIPGSEVTAMWFVAWYASTFFPRTYLETGIGRIYSAKIVTNASPGVSVVGVDPLQGGLLSNATSPIPLVNSMKDAGHLGNTRLVTSLPSEALADILAIEPLIDLSCIRADDMSKLGWDNLDPLIERTSPGGVIVLVGSNAEVFKKYWPSDKTLREWRTLADPSGCVGVAIKPMTDYESSRIS